VNAAARLAVAAVMAAGCATVPVAPHADGTAPWEIPPSELGQQSLFRVNYRGARGSGSLRLVLRLTSESDYQLAASDPFGRQLWSLSAAGDQGRWIDFRAERWCAMGDSFALPELGLPDLPLRAVPALLLGRLPVEPRESTAPASEVRDRRGRRWTLAAGESPGWTLWDGDQPVLWFREQGGENVLSSRRDGAQLRWRRTLREPSSGPSAGAEPPAAFAQGRCDEPRLP
jgi:hypothetical protein